MKLIATLGAAVAGIILAAGMALETDLHPTTPVQDFFMIVGVWRVILLMNRLETYK